MSGTTALLWLLIISMYPIYIPFEDPIPSWKKLLEPRKVLVINRLWARKAWRHEMMICKFKRYICVLGNCSWTSLYIQSEKDDRGLDFLEDKKRATGEKCKACGQWLFLNSFRESTMVCHKRGDTEETHCDISGIQDLDLEEEAVWVPLIRVLCMFV